MTGNQITRGADTFTWDLENRLTQSVVGGVTSSSAYYGNGVRRSHTVNGVTTNYVYDIGGSLPLVLQDGANTLVYGLDLISSTDGAGNQTYFSYDGLGSTTDLTDGTGTVTDTYSYDIFGAVRARTGTNASRWKFTGEQEDGAAGDTGYYFLRARYLDVATGRFISKDPLTFDQRCGYAKANPVRLVDRNGLEGDDTSAGPTVEYKQKWVEEYCTQRGHSCIGAPPPPDSYERFWNAAGEGIADVGRGSWRIVTSRSPDCYFWGSAWLLAGGTVAAAPFYPELIPFAAAAGDIHLIASEEMATSCIDRRD